jgi:hypothetical protein
MQRAGDVEERWGEIRGERQTHRVRDRQRQMRYREIQK